MKAKELHELWETTYHWLGLQGIHANKSFTRNEITSHPDYPAMTAVVDFLDAGHMDYNAAQADASYIHEFNYPLLAHIRKPGNEYLHIIKDYLNWDIDKEITKDWSGVVLYAEKNAGWVSEENKSYQAQSKRQQFSIVVFTVACLSIFLFVSLQQTYFPNIVFGILSMGGLGVSLIISGTELGYQSKLVKQVCGAVSNGGCERVIKSRYAKEIAGMSPGDFSVLYFATQSVCYLAVPFYPSAITAILSIALAGLPIASWSVYVQAVKLKQYCVLCLVIVAVLVAQATITLIWFTAIRFNFFPNFIFMGIIGFMAILLLIGMILLPVKQLLKTSNLYKIQKAELKKWKSDAGLFLAQLENEPACDNSIWENDLLIGNVDVPVRITVACNPYCSPCASAHKHLDKLIALHPGKVNVIIRFLCEPEKESDIKTIAVKALLQQAERIKDNSTLQQMISDWFDIMNYQEWSQKWLGNNADVSGKIKKHKTWIDESDVTHTPTFFVNGKKLPGRYSLDDLEKIIPELSKIFQAYSK